MNAIIIIASFLERLQLFNIIVVGKKFKSIHRT